MICRICNKICKNFRGLSVHCISIHKINSKEYYDKFFKKEGEGVCKNPYCNKETKFINMNSGYHDYDSCKCSNSDLDVKIKKKNTLISRYGVDNPSKSEEVKERKKNTCLKNYGVENPSKSEIIRGRKRIMWLNVYGVEHPIF